MKYHTETQNLISLQKSTTMNKTDFSNYTHIEANSCDK